MLLSPHVHVAAPARLPSNHWGLKLSPWDEYSVHPGFAPLESTQRVDLSTLLALGKGFRLRDAVPLTPGHGAL